MKSTALVVIGASAGGVEALLALLPQLPADLDAAVLVVLHTSAQSPGQLPQLLARHCALPVRFARDGEPLEPRQVLVARPEHHLLVLDAQLRVVDGPHENMARPAIDPLFRSAAVAATSRVIGVLLSGLLDDGSAGMLAIKRCGGITMIQDPVEALYPAMPENALHVGGVDYTVPLAELGVFITQLVQVNKSAEPIEPPLDLVQEVALMARVLADDERAPALDALGSQLPFTCPTCGGPLWALDGPDHAHYRCVRGHAFSEQSLLLPQDGAVVRALWVALKTLEDRVQLLKGIAADAQQRGRASSVEQTATRLQELEQAAAVLRSLLSTPPPQSPT